MTNRVVVTGMSLISPLGSSVKDAYNRLHSYNNCVSYQKELEKYENMNTCIAARLNDFVIPEYFDRKAKRTMGNVAIMAVATAKEALLMSEKAKVSNKINTIISTLGLYKVTGGVDLNKQTYSQNL